MKNRYEILIGIIVSFLYSLFQAPGAYGAFPQMMADVALIPVVAAAVRLLKLKDLTTAIFTLVIYQTWNMFLQPYLWQEKIVAMHRIIREQYIPEMAFYSMLSVWGLYFGFVIYQARRRRITPFFTNSEIPISKLSKILVWAIAIAVFMNIVEFLIGTFGISTSMVGTIMSMIPTAVLALFTLYVLRGGRNVILTIIIFIYTAFNFVYLVGGTLFIYSIILLSAPFATYIVERKKIPVIPIILLTVALLPIYYSRNEYRAEGLYSTGLERLEIGTKILEKEYGDFSLEKNHQRIEDNNEEMNVDNRFEGVSFLSTVVYCHKQLDYPWQYGKTFIWLPTLVIPRFLLPMRPGMNMGNEWAEYYKVKDKSWDCSINFPILVEFYANFGFPGMVILSFFQGWLLALICNKFGNGEGDYNMLFLILLMPKLIVIEANVTLAYGLILQFVFLIWIFKKIHPTYRKASPQRV